MFEASSTTQYCTALLLDNFLNFWKFRKFSISTPNEKSRGKKERRDEIVLAVAANVFSSPTLSLKPCFSVSSPSSKGNLEPGSSTRRLREVWQKKGISTTILWDDGCTLDLRCYNTCWSHFFWLNSLETVYF